MGFENEKDHPEVAPSQFEINYSYADVVTAADQIQLYKFLCRQVAQEHGADRQLPAEAGRRRQRQRHAHQRVGFEGQDEPVLGSERRREDQQVRLGVRGQDHQPRQRYLPGVESQRQLLTGVSIRISKRRISSIASAVDRGSMVRVPIGNERSSRIEVRAVAPDANPYMVLYSVFKTGLDGSIANIADLRSAKRFLPDNIYDAMDNFRKAEWTTNLFSEEVKERYLDLKKASADRCAAVAGDDGEVAGNSVPSRGLQPVPLESVLN